MTLQQTIPSAPSTSSLSSGKPPGEQPRCHYKKRLYLDLEAVTKQGLDLRLDEYIILIWAYDFASGGTNKSVTQGEQEYFWFKAEKCRKDLPILKLKSDRGVQFKFESLTQKGLLIPHPNRKGKGAHYQFSAKALALFKNHRVPSASLVSIDTTTWEARKQSLIAVCEEIIGDDSSLETFFEALTQHLLGSRQILRSDIDEFIVAALKSSSNNNRVNNKGVNHNSSILCRGEEIFESTIQETPNSTQARLPEILEVMAFHDEPREVAENQEQDILGVLGRTIPEEAMPAVVEEAATESSLECLPPCTLAFRQLPSYTRPRQEEDNTSKLLRLLPVAVSETNSNCLPAENPTTAHLPEELPVAVAAEEGAEETSAAETGLSREQVIDIFEWEGKSREEAIQFYQKHQSRLEAGELDIPDILEMLSPESSANISTGESGFENTGLSEQAAYLEDDVPETVEKGANQTYALAKKTFEVFSIHPSKEDLGELVRDILHIQQERDLDLKVMEKNLISYQAFIQTEGVTTNYKLQNWLKSKGNGYGKNWGQELERVQRQLAYQRQKSAPPKKQVYVAPDPPNPEDLSPLPDEYYEITGQPKPPDSIFGNTINSEPLPEIELTPIQKAFLKRGNQPLVDRIRGIAKPKNFDINNP